VEVFAGSAKLLFAKEPSRCEVLNDMKGDLINFFRVAKHRPAELAELFDRELIHSERFKELRDETTGDELTRALRFAYTTWYSYGAKGEHFAGANLKEMAKGRSRRPLGRIRELLDETAERLAGVVIEKRDFAEVLRRYDSAETFFYLDPPYVDYGSNGRYDALTPERRDELFGILGSLQGTFLMSFDDHADVRKLAYRHGLQIEEVQTSYGLGNTPGSRGKVTEVLITPGEALRAAA